jgi:Zn ribbon nucleic-acid-binding protein
MIKTIKNFKCPDCKQYNNIDEIMIDCIVSSEIIGIQSNFSKFEYNRPIIQQGHVSHYECNKCGYVIKDKNDNIITEDFELYKYFE